MIKVKTLRPRPRAEPEGIIRVHIRRVTPTPEQVAADRRFWESVIGRLGADEQHD